MSISKEQIRQDVLEYINSKIGIIDLEDHVPLINYNIDDYDVVDMEMELEDKYEVDTSKSSDIDSDDNLIEIIEKLYIYFNK